MVIINYYDTNNVDIKFENGYITHARYASFKSGNVRNPYDKTYCGIGYIGEGKYQSVIKNVMTKQYNSWRAMLQRCYDKSQVKIRIQYKGCSVCDDWLNFQTFAKWYDNNFYSVPNEKMCLDKDILHKGNKIYSPENCVFAPNNINVLFTKRQSCRGKYPIGVTCDKDGYIKANCNNGYGKNICLGYFDTIEEGFKAYKSYKEQLIKQIADNYKQYIPIKLYNALYNYTVEFTD